MNQDDLITIVILVGVAIAIGVILSSLVNRKKKVCAKPICDYENKCDAYCGGMVNGGCPKCPACKKCPAPLISPQEDTTQFQDADTTQFQDVDTTQFQDATIIEPIGMNYDNIFEKSMYPSTMNTDLKSSCGSIDRMETRQQMLGAPFPTNYKSMMI